MTTTGGTGELVSTGLKLFSPTPSLSPSLSGILPMIVTGISFDSPLHVRSSLVFKPDSSSIASKVSNDSVGDREGVVERDVTGVEGGEGMTNCSHASTSDRSILGTKR